MSEYLLGSRKMKPFPVGMSLVARYALHCEDDFVMFSDTLIKFSYISGVTILGTPAEIYNYGTQYWLIILAIILSGVAVSAIYLPVFTKIKVGSSYEV